MKNKYLSEKNNFKKKEKERRKDETK